MAQVATQDTSTGSFDASSGTVSHIVGSGEGLIVGVCGEVTDSGKRPDTVFWDVASSNQQLTRFGTVLLPGSGKMLLDVFFLPAPDAKTALVTVNMESAVKFGVIAVSVSDHNTTTMLSDRQTDEGNDTDGSVTVTQDADDLGMCFAAHFDSSGDFTATGDASEVVDFIVQDLLNMWCATGDTAGSTTLSWTQSVSKENSTYGFVVKVAAPSMDSWLGHHSQPVQLVTDMIPSGPMPGTNIS